jgi:TIGR02757 family protein
MKPNELKALLDETAARYETPTFIADDPISIPHRFTKLQDIEIAALFASTIAWGNRTAILKSCEHLLEICENAPYDFIVNSSKRDFSKIRNFYHRTFNGEDAFAFASALRRLYCEEHLQSLETLFAKTPGGSGTQPSLVERQASFRAEFCKNLPPRSKKHLGDMQGGSAAKKLNLFLRWMVRSNRCGVDFGLWKTISPAELFLPLDVHSARISRELGLLTRKSNDAKAVFEVTDVLKTFCPEDPAKYDFALFAVDV